MTLQRVSKCYAYREPWGYTKKTGGLFFLSPAHTKRAYTKCACYRCDYDLQMGEQRKLREQQTPSAGGDRAGKSLRRGARPARSFGREGGQGQGQGKGKRRAHSRCCSSDPLPPPLACWDVPARKGDRFIKRSGATLSHNIGGAALCPDSLTLLPVRGPTYTCLCPASKYSPKLRGAE